jgi:hypothetical protein
MPGAFELRIGDIRTSWYGTHEEIISVRHDVFLAAKDLT